MDFSREAPPWLLECPTASVSEALALQRRSRFFGNLSLTRTAWLLVAAGPALAVLFWTSCAGSDPSSPPPSPPPPATVATVAVDPSSADLAPGGTRQLTATLRDAAGNPLTGPSVSWSTNQAAVATASSTGLVTAVADGSATITATSQGKNGSASIEVTTPSPKVDWIVVFPSAIQLLTCGSVPIGNRVLDVAGNDLSGRQ
jgi:trimeric autotransporter adhesin